MKAARFVTALACAVVVVMFWTNDDNAGRPDAERGRGAYLPILDRGDGHMLYVMARSTAFDLDWSFADDLAAFGDPWGQAINPQTKRKEIPHPLGPALIWTPVLWVAHAVSKVANMFGADILSHGYTEWHQRWAFLTSVAAALLAILLGRRLAKQFIGGTWSPTYAAVAVLLGTSVTYYATYMPSYGHALDAGACGAFLGVWALTLGRTDFRRWLALGVLLGIAMLIRIQDVALGIVVALEIGVAITKDLRTGKIDWRVRAIGWVAGGACVLAIALIVFSPQLLYWHVVYGDWRTLPQGPAYTRLGSPMILELLYAPRNGWFSTTPVAYLGVIGLFCVPKSARFVAAGLGLALAVQVYLNATIIDWWGMSAWGQRRLCSVTIVLVFGLAALLWRCGRAAARLRRAPRAIWHVPAILVLGSMIAWNLWRVRELRAGRGASAELDPTCCERVPKRLRRPIEWVYNRIGNPFEFPANAWFALEHGVEIQRWDWAVGYYALMPSVQGLRDGTMFREVGAWRIGYPKAEPYLIGHWSPPYTTTGGQWLRWTLSPSVTVIVPNLMPYTQRFSLWVAKGGATKVIIRWDGDVVVDRIVDPGWQRVEWIIDDLSVGEHDLTIEATPAPVTSPEGWPQPKQPVGVGIGLLEISFARR